MRRLGSVLLAVAVTCVLALTLGRRGNEVLRAEFEAEKAARRALEAEVARLGLRLQEGDRGTQAGVPTTPPDGAAPPGFVPYRGELPEPISAASTPGLEALEEALRRGLVAVADVPLIERLEREARGHAQRLLEDRLFRLGEQARANALSSAEYLRDVEVETLWSPPFLFLATEGRARRPRTAVEGRPPSEWPSLSEIAGREPRYARVLAGVAEVFQSVYRGVLARHGADAGLAPLEDPYGGRPDLPRGARSFEDGFPIPVVVWAGKDAPAATSGPRSSFMEFGGVARSARDRGHGAVFTPSDGWVHVFAEDDGYDRGSVPTSTAAIGASMALFDAFERQGRAWRRARGTEDVIWMGITRTWGTWERDGAGALVRGRVPQAQREALDSLVKGPDGDGAPLLPLARLLRVTSLLQVGEEFAGAIGRQLGIRLYRAQAWAFLRFLEEHHARGGPALIDALLRERIRGDVGSEAWRRVLGLRAEDEIDALDAEFQRWVHDVLLPSLEPPPRPAAPR